MAIKKRITFHYTTKHFCKRSKELNQLPVELVGLYGWQNQDDNMYVAKGKIDKVDPEQLGYAISTDIGTSGTGVMIPKDRSIVAVHTHSGVSGDNHNYARRMTVKVIDEIRAWQS